MYQEMETFLRSNGIDLDDIVTFNIFWTAIGVAFWQCFFCLKYVFHPIAKKQVWYDQMCVLEEKTFASFGVTGLPAEKCGMLWVQCTLVMVQHLFGSLFCLPMLFGHEEAFGVTAIRLAQLAGICEMSWEIQDLLWWTATVLTDDDFGSSILIMFGGHHICGLVCVIPMNLYYSHHWEYCALVFALQFGAVVGVGSANFGFTFDVTQKIQLFFMWLLCAICAVIVPFTRGPAFCYLSYKLMIILWTTGASWALIACLMVGGLAMGFFNIILIIDCVSRAIKWTNVLFYGKAPGKEFNSAMDKEKRA